MSPNTLLEQEGNLNMQRKKIIIPNQLGLHARAAAKLAALAANFNSEVWIKYGDKRANSKSIMEIMMLAATQSAEIELIVEGADEIATLDALEKLINDKFGENV